MIRRNVIPALVLACFQLTCVSGDRVVSPEHAAPIPQYRTTIGEPCGGCVLGPIRLERGIGNPDLHVFEFSGDPAATYLMVLEGSQGANGSVLINGDRILAERARDDQSPRHHRGPLVVRSANRLVVRLTGKPGSVLVLYVLAGAADIGPAGGLVVAPGSGAEIEVPIGAFSEPVLVQLRDTAGVQPRYTPLGLTGHVLHFALASSTAVDSTNPSTLNLRLPLAVDVSTGTPVHVRAMLGGLDSSSWWGTGVAADAQAEFAIPAAGLSELPTVFRTLDLSLVLNLEAVSTLGLTGSSLSVNSSAPSSCDNYPAPGEGWPAAGALRVDPNTELHEGSVAVIAVHGFDPAWDAFDCDHFADEAESGEVYFKQLLRVLEAEFGKTPILVFTYPTFNDFEYSGQQLAARLNGLHQLGGVVLLGHSMGGLVAREAAHVLANTPYNRPAGFVRGIVTLGTPHGGLTLPVLLKAFAVLRTDGARSLERGVIRQTEEAPIYAYAGDLVKVDPARSSSDCEGYTRVLYLIGCELYKPFSNDGLVPTVSALPSFITKGVRHSSPYQGYDHSEMRAGRDLVGGLSDPLFTAVVADIRGLLPQQLAFSVPPTTTTVGATITPAVQVTARDAQGNTTKFTGSVTVAIGTNPSGGTLSGTTTAPAVAGVATFGNLSINKVGTGYTLTATATGLTGATSAAFTINTAPTTQLAFSVQPTTTTAGATITPAVQVVARDAQGTTATGFTGSVTVAIGTNPSSGTLSGTTTAPAMAGVATFGDLSIGNAGTGYTLTAAASGLMGATSEAFAITGLQLLRPARGEVIPQNNPATGCSYFDDPSFPYIFGYGLRIDFDWTDVPLATGYDLFVTYPTAAFPIVDTHVAESNHTDIRCASLVEPLHLQGWRWRVRPVFSTGPGEWVESTFDFGPPTPRMVETAAGR